MIQIIKKNIQFWNLADTKKNKPYRLLMPENDLKSNVDIKHFELIFANCALGIIITDEGGKIISVNPCALKEFGYVAKELIGNKMEMLFSERYYTRQKASQNIPVIQNNLKDLSKDLFAIRKDGSRFPVEINVSNYTSDGNKYAISSFNNSDYKKVENANIKPDSEMDDTEVHRRKELKKALKELEKVQSFHKAILENAGAMIIATDEYGIIRLFNPHAALKLGYRPSEILDKETPVLFHIEQDIENKRRHLLNEFGIKSDNSFNVLVEKARRNIHEEVQYNYVSKAGNLFPVSLTISALRNADGAVTGFMAIAFDISERIKAEKKIKTVERLFLQLLHNYPDGIVSIIDQNYHFVYTGGELHRLLHVDIGTLIGREIFPMFPEPLRKIILPMLESIFQDKIFITDFELPHPIANGIYIMDAFPLIEEDGSINNIGVIIKNISKLKQAEKGLRADLKIERDLNELKSSFVSMASHEFRTPLSTILSSAYLIEKYALAEDQPKRERHLQRIVSSVNMLTDILNDFLSLGKIEEGKLQAKFSEFNLQEMIEATLDEIKNNLKKDQQIHYHAEGNPIVFLDPTLLKHIVMNLVSNASKFSPKSSQIDIKTGRENGHIILSIKDHGIGISKEDQKHLEERFFRATNAQDIQGTGLGLHIVSQYAEMMNGHLRCKSELGKGAEFIVEFKPSNN